MQPSSLLVAFAALGIATPISFSEMLGMIPEDPVPVSTNQTTKTTNTATATTQKEDVVRRDAAPISLSEMLDMIPEDPVPVSGNQTTPQSTTTTTTTTENEKVRRNDADDNTKSSEKVSDWVADLFGQGAEVNGTEATASEARENQNEGGSWDGPVYDGVKGFRLNHEHFDDDPDAPDGPSVNGPGGAQYPH